MLSRVLFPNLFSNLRTWYHRHHFIENTLGHLRLSCGNSWGEGTPTSGTENSISESFTKWFPWRKNLPGLIWIIGDSDNHCRAQAGMNIRSSVPNSRTCSPPRLFSLRCLIRTPERFESACFRNSFNSDWKPLPCYFDSNSIILQVGVLTVKTSQLHSSRNRDSYRILKLWPAYSSERSY